MSYGIQLEFLSLIKKMGEQNFACFYILIIFNWNRVKNLFLQFWLLFFTGYEVTAHGVRQELWYQIPSTAVENLLDDGRFPKSPDAVRILQNLDAGSNFHHSYGQRLATYLQVC